MRLKLHNLTVQNGRFFFRIGVPHDVRGRIGQWELKKSLNSEDLNEAQKVCKILTGKFKKLFCEVRNNMVSNEEIIKAVKDHFASVSSIDDEERLMSGEKTSADFRRELEFHNRLLFHHKNNLVLNRLDSASKEADCINNKYALEIDKGSLSYKFLCSETLKELVKWMEEQRDKHLGKYPEKNTDVIQIRKEEPQMEAKEPAPLIKDLAKDYFEQKLKERAWTPRTARGEKEIFDLLYEVFGNDARISDFTHKKLFDFRNNILLKLPPNRNKIKKYRGKTCAQILAMKNVEPIKVNTANSKISKISTFFDWCFSHEFTDRNFAEGLMLKVKTDPRDEKKLYSKDELIKILQLLPYHNIRAFRYWVPIISLLSGLRQAEICQLLCSDILVKDDIHYFYAIETEEGQRIKNKGSRRAVPVHPILIKLGFLDYVSSVKHKELWPNLIAGRDGKGQKFSRWYNDGFNRKHITLDPKTTFHSLRHNFINNLADNEAAESVISEIAGHAHKGETMGRYKKTYDIKILYKGICKLDYGFDIVKVVKESMKKAK